MFTLTGAYMMHHQSYIRCLLANFIIWKWEQTFQQHLPKASGQCLNEIKNFHEKKVHKACLGTMYLRVCVCVFCNHIFIFITPTSKLVYIFYTPKQASSKSGLLQSLSRSMVIYCWKEIWAFYCLGDFGGVYTFQLEFSKDLS